MNQSRLRTALSLAAISLCLALAIPPARAMTFQQAAQLAAQAASGKNPAALQSLQAAANNGDANAQFSLGFLYEQGQGVPQNYTQAAFWYLKAADQGYAMAQFNLGNLYEQGQGAPQDDTQATSWWRKAADQGFAAAQNNLGAMYQFGVSVPQDYAIAYALYNLAAASGYTKASADRDSISQQMSEADIESGQNLTRMMQNLGVTAAINAYANK